MHCWPAQMTGWLWSSPLTPGSPHSWQELESEKIILECHTVIFHASNWTFPCIVHEKESFIIHNTPSKKQPFKYRQINQYTSRPWPSTLLVMAHIILTKLCSRVYVCQLKACSNICSLLPQSDPIQDRKSKPEALCQAFEHWESFFSLSLSHQEADPGRKHLINSKNVISRSHLPAPL